MGKFSATKCHIKWSVTPHPADTKWTISVLIMVTVYDPGDSHSGSHDKFDLKLMIGQDIVIGTAWWFLHWSHQDISAC